MTSIITAKRTSHYSVLTWPKLALDTERLYRNWWKILLALNSVLSMKKMEENMWHVHVKKVPRKYFHGLSSPKGFQRNNLTLTLPGLSAGMSGSLDSYCSLKPLCSGMGEVVPARTSPTLLPPSPCTVLSLSCFKVSQCINCRDWHFKS